jgi:hypothetical protein
MILLKVRDPRFVTIRRGGTLTDSDHHLLALSAASSLRLRRVVAGGGRHRRGPRRLKTGQPIRSARDTMIPSGPRT